MELRVVIPGIVMLSEYRSYGILRWSGTILVCQGVQIYPQSLSQPHFFRN